jgi:Na+-transporting methylmalonyl-CoA/oxaloacetate decarboxylase gamma subunit
MAAWSTVEQALIITLIGVSSIFIVLFVLWGLMAALVHFTAPRPAAPTDEAGADTRLDAITPADASLQQQARRRRAAVAAVAVALATEAEQARKAPFLQPAQGAISPWQATLRGNALSRRAGVYRRNPPSQ